MPINLNKKPAEFWKTLNSHKKILVFTHSHPDPDTFCSAAFLTYKLLKQGKDTYLVVPNHLPYTMDSAKTRSERVIGNNRVILLHEQGNKKQLLKNPDASFIVDAFGPSRTESAEHFVQGITFAIDHHTIEPRADYYLWDPSLSSTALVIYKYLIQNGPLEVEDADEAYFLLSAMLTDNGWFRYPSTKYYDLEAVKDLGERFNINPSEIATEFLGKRMQTLKMLQLSIERLEINDIETQSQKRVRLAYTYTSLPDLQKYGATWEDTESVATLISELREADIIAIAKEQEKLLYRVSFRTRKKDIDVSQIATELGGGGHKTSAATKMEGGPIWIKKKIIQAIKEKI